MEVTVKIKYEQLLEMAKKLPAAKIKQLKLDLDEGLVEEKKIARISDFQNFLLGGPVMSKEQYSQHLENRKHFSRWRVR